MLVVGHPLGAGTAFGCSDSRNRRRARMETHINETTVMVIRFPTFLERENAAILIESRGGFRRETTRECIPRPRIYRFTQGQSKPRVTFVFRGEHGRK